jgi:hypothetical protein
LYSGKIASVGQTSAQVAQPMQYRSISFDCCTTWLSRRVTFGSGLDPSDVTIRWVRTTGSMALTGQTAVQRPQRVQRSSRHRMI